MSVKRNKGQKDMSEPTPAAIDSIEVVNVDPEPVLETVTIETEEIVLEVNPEQQELVVENSTICTPELEIPVIENVNIPLTQRVDDVIVYHEKEMLNPKTVRRFELVLMALAKNKTDFGGEVLISKITAFDITVVDSYCKSHYFQL